MRHGQLPGLFRASPLPATLQDDRFRLVDVNDAYLAYTGLARERLIGRDPIELQPAEDRAANLAARRDLAAARRAPAAPLQRRLIDASGHERWFWITGHNIAPEGASPLWLSMLHDATSELAAREEAQRAQDELAHWFQLSGVGMLVFDASGLVLRSNAAFEALVGRVPVLIGEAGPELQALLGWADGSLRLELRPGAPPTEREAPVRLPDGRWRRLHARLACAAGSPGAPPRVMAVVQDRSAEAERDLARAEIGMLMDAASGGVATWDPARGWLAAPRPASGGGSGALEGIHRELVDPASRSEYERLQRALKRGERVEVRYAVRHPSHGLRWLMTRVEPAPLAGGGAASVVTLDVTEQEQAERRNQQLLRELTTILDSSTAGIAYLRGTLLVRCNRRFERMLGLAPGAGAGASLEELFGQRTESNPVLRGAIAALHRGESFEAELPVAEGTWYAVSVRRAEGASDAAEAVAVLTDISRLKAQQTELERLLRERELMFDLSEVGIVYVRGARIERANQAMAALTGYAAPELTTLDPAELHASARACIEHEARVAAALKLDGRFLGERLLRRRDGRLIWVQLSVRPVDEAEPEAGSICSFVDVDERHRARESLALQAERTRAVLDSVLVGIVSVSGQGIEWMNRSARRMFAGELADFVGEPLAVLAGDEAEHPLRRADWLERLDDGQSETFECRLQARDGRRFWVVGNVVATPVDGQTRQLTFALLDIERRRQAEVSIAQAQASLSRVIETAPLAIALIDGGSLRVLQCNQRAAEFFGRDRGQMPGARPEEGWPPAQANALVDRLVEATHGAAARRHEFHDGKGRVWDLRVAPLDSGADGALQLLLVAADVTEQRAADQARLAEAIAQRETLVREVHHRIKNNLQGVAGLLQQTAARHPELATVLAEAVGQVQAIAQVHGLQVGASGPISLGGLISAVAATVGRAFGRAVSVGATGGADWLLPEAEAIPVALTLNELLANALKHGRGPAATIAAAAADGGVAIQVTNEGMLPPGFDLAQYPGGVAGLGLVRALLPRRHARLSIVQEGEQVVARVVLVPPAVRPGGSATIAGAEG